MIILYQILAAFGISVGLSIGKIFNPLKKWLNSFYGIIPEYIVKLINCPMCSGFWIGVFMTGPLDNMLLNGGFYAATNLLLWVPFAKYWLELEV